MKPTPALPWLFGLTGTVSAILSQLDKNGGTLPGWVLPALVTFGLGFVLPFLVSWLRRDAHARVEAAARTDDPHDDVRAAAFARLELALVDALERKDPAAVQRTLEALHGITRSGGARA